MLRVLQPCTALKHSRPRSRKESHLRRQLAGLLTSIVEVSCQYLVEEQHSLADRHSVLGAAKAKHVNAALPAQLRRSASEACAGVGKPRSIHVQRESMLFARVRNLLHL